MLISTRGRYALRVLIDLAEYEEDGYTPLKESARPQDISQKNMESIMTKLSKNKLVEGVHGKGGGYRLNRSPEDYSVGEILRITEGTLAPVACLERDAQPCPRAADCRTLPLWDKLNDMITGYLDSVSLADLMKK